MHKSTLVAVLVLLTLAACQAPAPVPEPRPPRVEAPPPQPAPPPVVQPPAPPPVPVPTASERALTEGVGLYDAGDFSGAIKSLLGARPIWEDSTPGGLAVKVAAHKYLAFAYCVTNRRPQCRQHFVDVLRLDPKFSLDPAEKTHPVWGPEFERAKTQAAAPATPARRPAASAPPGPPKAP
jgi:hypothetical protein